MFSSFITCFEFLCPGSRASSLQIMSSSTIGTFQEYSLDEIKYATNNFDDSNILLNDGFGKLYLATVMLGKKFTQVTVKHVDDNKELFLKEACTMSKIKHPNLVSPVGYCYESGQMFLLNEYMEKGRLSDCVKKESLISLPWLTRIRICLDAARGLQRLHMPTDEFPRGIIHRDVKPRTILLGKDWEAKMDVSGISKFSHASQVQPTMVTVLKGTYGYFAPEYINYSSVTRKIDVYAFGVVLFEVLCRKMPWDRGDESYDPTDDEDLGIWAQENVDPRIIAEISDDSLKEYTAIISATLERDSRKRPTMDSLVLNLEKVLILAKKGRAASAMKWKGTGLDYTEDKTRVLKLLETEAEAEKKGTGLDYTEDAKRVLKLLETEAEKKGRAAGESNDERSTARYRRRGKCIHISLDELIVATNTFDKKNFLGKGGEARVYRASIKIDGMLTEVAVKLLDPKSTEFDTEIMIMSEINHNNILPLLGYCDQFGEKILIYEFMEKGSLTKYVRKRQASSGLLSWLQRLRICLDVARGLQHLHVKTEKNSKGIIHRDIKPDNILLGKDWVAKISDFGMFKLSEAGQVESNMETVLKGTTGYFAPEYNKFRQVSRKTDVYCFGIVLFQVLCLTMPWDRGEETYIMREEEDLGNWAAQNADPKIKADICDDSLKAYTAIIGKSLKEDPHKRPTMDDVVCQLEISLKCQEMNK